MTKYNKAILAVTLTLVKDNKVLLVRRKSTGYMDGYYAMPGGHVEPDETILEAAVRELEEETTLRIKPEDLQLFHVHQDENMSPKNYIVFRFKATKWSGEPKLVEKDKSDDVRFFDIAGPPDKLSPYSQLDIEALKKEGITFSRAEKGELNEY